MSNFSFYRLDTGELTGVSLHTSDPKMLAMNIPEGCGYVEGTYDHFFNRVDLNTMQVVSRDPPPEFHQRAEHMVRARRDRMLTETDWRVARAMELGNKPSDALTTYRQLLRDLPKQPGFPHEVIWPQLKD